MTVQAETTEAPSCRWCGKTEDRHVESRSKNAPQPRTPCLLLKRYFLKSESPPAVVPETGEYRVHRVQTLLCEACLMGIGQMCRTPACALCWHNSPGFPIGPELYEVVKEPT